MFLTALAIIPGAVLLAMVYKLDKIEKEPKKLLVKLFIFGILSIIPSIIFEMIGEGIMSVLFSKQSFIAMFIENFFVIALVEEGFKYLFTMLGSWKDKAFNYRFDAIVYAICVSMGFAIVENIMYVSQYGLMTAIMRAVMSIPGHCIFALYMGYYMGNAKMQEKMHNPKKGKSLRLALLVPVLLHGSYDFMASSSSEIMTLAFLIFVVVIEVNAIIQIRKYSKQDMPLPY